MRLLFMTDFTELFPYRLLRGILRYSREMNEHWAVCKMPPSFKKEKGLDIVLRFALDWRADIIIGQFDPEDDVQLFRKNGIVVLAQDYISRFKDIPNITGDYRRMGAMAARRFIARGFKEFAFFGNNGMCWSDERRDGFYDELVQAGFEGHIHLYDRQRINNLWFYYQSRLGEWLQSLPKPVGIMACDDNQGSILVEACALLGIRIPFDVAIIGVDNDEIQCNMLVPSLSSIDVDIERGGYEAAALAKHMVQNPGDPGHDIVLEPLHIVTRESSNTITSKDNMVLEALMFIHSNMDHKIQVGDVLQHIPLSRRLLEQRFRKGTGMSIYDYIIQLRVNRFTQLLLDSDESITNIAASMDEPDPKNLSRLFRKVKGYSPTEFRKLNLRDLPE